MTFKKHIENSLALCMIVKDEADMIANSIDSVRNLVGEIIVLDTGSTDGTQKIAADLGAIVQEATWEDDYSMLRNRSLSLTKSKWILVMDADETLDSQGCHAIRQWIHQTNEECADLLQTTYSNDHYQIGWKPNKFRASHLNSYQGYVESWTTRLFINRPDIRFHKRVHEEVLTNGVKPHDVHRMSQARLHHFGRVREKSRDETVKLYLKLAHMRLKDHPEDTDACFDYGFALWESGREDEALAAFDKVLGVLPAHMNALIAAARIQKNNKNYPRAKQLLMEVLRLCPNQLQALQIFGETLCLMGDFSEALKSFLKARNVGLESADLLTRLGEVYFRIGKLTEARQYLTAAINQNPKYPHAWLGMGMVLHQAGYKNEAKNFIKKGIDLLSCSDTDLQLAKLGCREIGIDYLEGQDL